MAAGLDPPRHVERARLPAGGRREDVQDAAQPDRPGRPRRRLRRRRVPLPLPAGHTVRARRRLLLRGHGRPLQRRPRQQPRQPAVTGGDRRAARSAAVWAARRRPTARWPRSRPRPTRARPRPGTTCSRRSRSRRRGGSSARPTPTSRPTSRGGWSRVPRSTPSSATPSRRCASWPCSRSPAVPRRRRDLAPHRARRLARATSGCRPPRRGAATPAACPVEKGPPLFPRLN